MALQCYQCNSETHRRCLSEDRLIDKFLMECPPSKFNYSGMKPIPFCSKINQWRELHIPVDILPKIKLFSFYFSVLHKKEERSSHKKLQLLSQIQGQM